MWHVEGAFSDEMHEKVIVAFEKEMQEEGAKAAAMEAQNEASFSLGTPGVFERRRMLNAGFGERSGAIADRYSEETEQMPEQLAAELQDRRLAAAGTQHWALNAPLWMQMSGLYPQSHREMSPNERAGRIRGLLRRAERMIRWALGQRQKAEGERQMAEGGEQKAETATATASASATESGDSVIEQTVIWSPVREICVYLEIPQRVLSGLCREITGMSIENVVDRIRAEKLRAEFAKRLKAFVLEWFSVAENWRKSVGKKRAEIADMIFAALKSSRRTRFHRTQWAFELGFSSYQRLFRAALLSEGLTPHQMEMDVLEELVPEDEGATCVGGQNQKADGGMQKTATDSGAESLYKEAKPG